MFIHVPQPFKNVIPCMAVQLLTRFQLNSVLPICGIFTQLWFPGWVASTIADLYKADDISII